MRGTERRSEARILKPTMIAITSGSISGTERRSEARRIGHNISEGLGDIWDRKMGGRAGNGAVKGAVTAPVSGQNEAEKAGGDHFGAK